MGGQKCILACSKLVPLLQQANLVPSTSSSSNRTTNHIQATPLISTSIFANASDTVGLPLSQILPRKSSYWYLDPGANEHICFNLPYFTSFCKIKLVCVSLPNVASTIVQYAGNVTFTTQFYLNNVLYSPLFHVNLIPVVKHCQSLSCVLHFSLDKCLIHDQTSLKMIGLANQVDSLYKYIPPPSVGHRNFTSSFNKACNFSFQSICNSSTSIPVTALWHFRLGHLSHQRMTKMFQLYPYIVSNKKVVCDICNFAKQKHLPFPSSLSHATPNFELIHFDI